MAEVVVKVGLENLLSSICDVFVTRYYAEIKEMAEELLSALELLKKAFGEDVDEEKEGNSCLELLQQLRDALFMLEDIRDEYCTLFVQPRYMSSYDILRRLMNHRRFPSRMKVIRRIFDVLKADTELAGIKLSQARRKKRGEPQVYGRDDDKEKIIEFLHSQAHGSHPLSIYPIVGLGGIGKSTLARMVYRDERVSTLFNITIWVLVSKNFTIKKILCSIIESIAKEKYDVYDMDVTERKVQELLQSKRYLLVLDNVWTTDDPKLKFGLSQHDLEKLKSVLACGSKGACILVTTRNMHVAAIMGTFQPHHLSPLSEEYCWSIFKQYAFGPDKEERAELEAIGKEMVKKCRGVPLAAQALGDLMHPKNEIEEWLEVKEKWSWDVPDDNSAPSVLRLIYSELTPIVKLCFAFCAIFPKSTKIMKEDLIHLWMANGFISSEEVGNNIWNELNYKIFFTDVDDCSGDISFKMHDLVHDLAQSVSEQKCMILDNINMTDLSTTILHIGFGSGLLSFSKGTFQKVKSLRTLYQFEFAFYNTISGSFPTNRSLRVLRTSYFKLSSLRNLIHLRYLELYSFEIKNLPNSIYSLQQLETLKLTSCRKLMCLPKHLTRLQNLRHLVISECHSLSHMSPNMRKLSCLRTLSLFVVSLKTGHSLEELGGLNLGGKLCIEGLKNIARLSEAKGANLMDKTNLQELCLSWDNSGETKSNATNAEEVLEALQPPQHLKTMRIYDYEGLHLPSWIRYLTSLVALELFNCKKCLHLPQLGKLPFLRKLEIFSVDYVQYVDDDESYDGGVVDWAFPSLAELEVRGLPNLQQLLKVKSGKMFPLLANVTVHDCSKLRLPSLPSIKQLNIRGCNRELLRSISSFNGLTSLNLSGGEDLTFLPEGMVTNLSYLKTMILYDFPKLKELPHELLSLNALEHLEIKFCGELESLPEHVWEGFSSLQYLEIAYCGRLRSMPEGVRQVKSLGVLRIECCPELEKRCKNGTGEDWDKIAHIRRVILLQ